MFLIGIAETIIDLNGLDESIFDFIDFFVHLNKRRFNDFY
jgi:hypothetical protein